jgi:hypothetical protein
MKNRNNDNSDKYDIYTIKKEKINNQKNLMNNLLDDKNNQKNNKKEYYYCNLNNNKCILDYSTKNFNNTTDNNNDIKSNFNESNFFSTNEYKFKKNDNLEDINYTDCIDVNNVNNLKDENKIYDNACRKKYGYEYIYDNNIFDIKSKISCDKNKKKVKCKLNFENTDILEFNLNKNPVEHFNNHNNENNKKNNLNLINNNYLILLMIFFMIFFIILYI